MARWLLYDIIWLNNTIWLNDDETAIDTHEQGTRRRNMKKEQKAYTKSLQQKLSISSACVPLSFLLEFQVAFYIYTLYYNIIAHINW